MTGEDAMQNRRTCQLLFTTGICLILLQILFGLWLMFFTWLRPIDTLTAALGDTTTSEGAKFSLVHFGSSALLAGFASGLILTIAGSLMRRRTTSVPAGILLIAAGAANSVILFSAGLPAGVVLMAAGVLLLSNAGKGESRKPT